MEKKQLYKINVKGKVQGVGFRWSAARVAKSLGLTGYVKNLSDGSVYIEAQGSEEQLKAFVIWCRKGPGLSKIDSINIDSFPPVNHSDFRIEN